MKTHITAPQLKKLAQCTGKPILACSYCNLQDCLRGWQPIFYNAGTYGWNYDVYSLDSCYIVTGYRFPATIGTVISYTKCMEMSGKAEENYRKLNSNPIAYGTMHNRERLQRKFVRGLLEEIIRGRRT